MYSLKTYIIIIALWFVKAWSYAQNPVFEHMSAVSKLPDVEFYDILEDRNNFIWFAADKGLFRYDGKSYTRYSHADQKANSLFQLKEDQEGKLWCNNIYGQLFYAENDQLHLFYDASQLVKGQLAAYTILDHHIRLFTTTGIFDIDKTTKKITKVFEGLCISNANSKSSNYVFVIKKEGQLNKHSVYKIEGAHPAKLFEINSLKLIQSPRLFAFKEEVFLTHKSDSENIIYIINKADDSIKQPKTPLELKDEIIYNLLNFENDYWFLTTAGIFVYQLKNGHFIFKEQLFKTESITDVEVDFNNNYWFATLDNGVFVSPNLEIRHVALAPTKSKITASCALNANQFVLGTNDGKLFFYDQLRRIKTLKLPGQKIIGNLFYDEKQQQLIISINASESFIVNLKNDKITDAINKFSVAKSISKLNDSLLFYGNFKEGIVYNNPYNSKEKNILRSSRVKASVVHKDTLFVAYMDGLFQYDLNHFSSEELQFKGQSLLVNAMCQSKVGVWLATQHNGLMRLADNRLQKSIVQLPKEVQINTVKSDGDDLWISTDVGLFQYNTRSHNLKSLSAQDGLNTAVDEFLILKDFIIVSLPQSFYVLPKGTRLFKNFKTSKIALEAIRINDRDTILQSQYQLPYDANKIELQFNSNGFQSNKHVTYHYRVQQLDSSWQTVQLNTHVINFNSLASGRYLVELKAKNVSAKKAVFASPISFVIAKPFWETWWFYTLILISVFGLIWLYFRWQLHQKEEQRITEIDKILIDKKITNLRLENLRSQMNPHFIFNALNSIQDYIVSNEKELASSYLVKFSRLIRMYLDYSQQNEITLEEELNALKLYLELEKVRFEDELEYHITVDNLLNTNQIKVPSLFIQPYVENALKHGLLHKSGYRNLTVDAKVVQQNKLQITVEDNGIGREQSEKLKRPNQHKPFATKANEERVHLYKNKLKRDITIVIEDLYDESHTALGTRVVIIMPI
ncbi:sensor histidine kinase [Winogradskyella arenosi]|uniref:YXYXY domain-containing protein n=1 Tax=Winogradskyella arenosi TaxID=533325 RepID=A0A368ZG61_9FLAO|nr:histidine kinase [Winogradskyella arenosi]RCW92514.1 YXYXY domain-containing protein [Winogradskyella arenosi]